MSTMPRACVHAEPGEYVIEVDVADVDVERLTASAAHGSLEIRVPRVLPGGKTLRFLNPQAEAD